jgi:uncharacterized protein (TIGR00156 family)
MTSPRHLITTLASMAALSLSATVAQAQYVGPSTTTNYKNVAEILKNPVDDTVVVLSGHLLRKVGKEKYIFSDGSAEIRVEVDAKYFPATPISDKTKVQITGEVEKEFMSSPEIDVKGLTILP